MNKDIDSLSDTLADILQIIQSSLTLIEEGQHCFYRVLALQLRILLCDHTRRHGKYVNISLLHRVCPDIRLTGVKPDGSPDHEKESLPIDNWLQQELVFENRARIDLRTLIRRVCDQDGGAHFDPKPDAGVHLYPGYDHKIIALAKIILEDINSFLIK